MGELKALRGLKAEQALNAVSRTEPYYDDFVRLSKELEGKSADEAVEYLRKGVSVEANIFINGWTKEKILALAKGQRPNPTEYLSADYIQQHLAKFDNGVTKITMSNPTGNIGPLSGTFVMPKSVADDMIKKANGNIETLENLLGLEKGSLGSQPYRIDIVKFENLRMCSGNELGANEMWIPGGFTSGNIPEATVDQIKTGSYISSQILK